MFYPHPSGTLTRMFSERPWQGADPLRARFVFVGLDANYDPRIEASTLWPMVLDYHSDGVAFWQRHRVHHPFLLPGYTGDGKRFHRTFARIGFTPDEAEDVSFVELVNVPTSGRSALVPGDLDDAHLNFLERVMFDGSALHVFISAGVARLMAATQRFSRLKREAGAAVLPKLYSDAYRSVYLHLHFSNYGKFQGQLDRELIAISALR